MTSKFACKDPRRNLFVCGNPVNDFALRGEKRVNCVELPVCKTEAFCRMYPVYYFQIELHLLQNKHKSLCLQSILQKSFKFSLFWLFSSVQKYSRISCTVLPSTSEDRAKDAGHVACATRVARLNFIKSVHC